MNRFLLRMFLPLLILFTLTACQTPQTREQAPDTPIPAATPAVVPSTIEITDEAPSDEVSLTNTGRKKPLPAATPAAPFKPALIKNGELPAAQPSDKIVKRTAYVIAWNEDHHLAKWVAHRLTNAGVQSELFQRKNNWKTDPDFASSTSADYLRSGYQKGHLAPAEDFESDKKAMDESFYYGNAAPQTAKFNPQIWLDVEVQARNLAKAHGEVMIVTGTVLDTGLPRLAKRASIPKRFYKSVVFVENGKLRATSWIVPQEYKKRDQKLYLVSVDAVEKATGLDLFAAYPNDIEAEFEK